MYFLIFVFLQYLQYFHSEIQAILNRILCARKATLIRIPTGIKVRNVSAKYFPNYSAILRCDIEFCPTTVGNLIESLQI